MKEQTETKQASTQFLKTDRGKTKSNAIEVPSIALPKGGGAIKGIDEKFSVNAVNGTSSFSLPLPFAPARGPSPSLTISYNSGGGNSIFGLGWSLGISSIKRKTDKGLPQYFDAADSDTFLFSEAEDLVPEFKKEADGRFSLDSRGDYIIHEKDSADGLFIIRYYKPRIEGMFARIERWRSKSNTEIKWRVTTKENVCTLFGWSTASRIADPKDPGRIYEWLPEFVFDDKGNCAYYSYKKEDNKGFAPSLLHNRNRFADGTITYTNLYLEKVYYGNKTPYESFGDSFPAESNYLFTTAFDYGQYNLHAPYDSIHNWDYRTDAFSDYKAGFEIRTTRRCRRVLLFHHFTGPNEYEGLVKSLNLEFDTSTEKDFTFLKSITSCGYIKKANGTYSSKHFPTIEFEYQKHEWNKEVKAVPQNSLVHAPAGFDEAPYQFTDLFNEGLSGILSEQANGWYYKHNLGDGNFEPAKLVTPKPSFTGLGNHLHLADLGADGGKQLVSYGTEPKGYFELEDDKDWQGFRSFEKLPNVNLGDANTRLLDLNGDGKAEILISEDQVFTWYPSDGRLGFSQAFRIPKAFDEEAGPTVVFADDQQNIFLADMSGDGMTDLIRIRNGEVCYWPNLGYGKFGAKVAMDHAPLFDHPEAFNPVYLRLADIDGSGTSDIVYLGNNKFSCWMNLSGNSFSIAPFEINAFPEINNKANITVTDLLGNGVACIVWSGGLPKDSHAPIRYIDLMSSKKPHILLGYKNNLGKEVSLEYTPSTKFYIEDKLAGKPWATKLHFPVHCVSQVETRDRISGYRFVNSYKYHHGYYDHAEREFRGFGMVEQIDSEHFEHWVKGTASNIVDDELHQEPVVSKAWYHTGAFLGKDAILTQYAHEYWYEEMARHGFPLLHPELPLADARLILAPGIGPSLTDKLSIDEWREALRACKGMSLRSEVFAKDALKNGNTAEDRRTALTPFTVATHNCMIELLQPRGQNRHAIFVVKESEAITYSYERNPEDPRIAHNLNIKLDDYGNILESASVVYPRRIPDTSLPAEIREQQEKTIIIYTKNTFTKDVISDDAYRLRLPSETQTFEMKGIDKAGVFYAPSDFTDVLSAATEVDYHEIELDPGAGTPQKRLVEHMRSTYYRNDLSGALPLHELESLALPFENYQLAYTPKLLMDIYNTLVNDATMTEGRFTHSENDTNWWIRSGTTQFIWDTESRLDAQKRFFTPISYTDPYGAKTRVKYYADYSLFIEETEDALGNKAVVKNFDFRTLSPQRMQDPNGNLSEVISDELGLVKAMAILGKGTEADDLAGLNQFTDAAETTAVNGFFSTIDAASLTTKGKSLLQHATTRFVYDLEAYKNSGKPAVVASIVREEHFQKNSNSPIQLSFEYSNGLGQVVMKKVQAEPGMAKKVEVNPDNTYSISHEDTSALNPKQLRWIGNGRSILNNKGKAVKQYEPYFSVIHHYEDMKELVETGVTPILYYDAAGRLIKTVMPDATFSKEEFDSWKKTLYDANDTLLNSDWYTNRINRLVDTQLTAEGKDPGREKAAADKAAKHAHTPNVMHFDSLGRSVLSVEHNRNMATNADEFYHTKVTLDTEGNLRSVKDERGNLVMQYKYDMLGHQVYQKSMDAGQRWLLANILGSPLRTWDERKHELQYFYDTLHRPAYSVVKGGDGPASLNNIFDRITYGEDLLQPGRANEAALQLKNVLGQVVQHFDTGGLKETSEFDFKGRPLSTSRRLFKKYKEVANWTDANLANDLETDTFTYITTLDALGRITSQVAPDTSIITPSYNEAGLLSAEKVNHPDGSSTDYIKDIDYNEKGQRNKIIYGNNVITRFYYDKETFRLKRLETKRQNNDPLQDWYYTYDPVGNITHIEDKNIPVVFFNNQKVTGVSEYTYDALYRLAEATGRENSAALSFGTCDNWHDKPFRQRMNAGDPMAVRNYTQRYQYDSVGNILQVKHLAAAADWTRNYEYQNTNNRIKSTRIGDNGSPADYTKYKHHPLHGYLEELPHLEKISWSFKEQVVLTIRQHCTDDNVPVITYYQYDGQGQRIRKITENAASGGGMSTKKEERIYVAGYELYKKHRGTHAGLERVSLSLLEENHRFVMIESRNDVDDGTEKKLVRYQLHKHLGSAALELDARGEVISYEEYHPYGTTAYQANSAAIKSAAKRYRYTGMERDEETGLEYHSARYYLPWLGRWLSSDPGGLIDGANLYRYGRNNPIKLADPNGMDPPAEENPPFRLTPLLTDISPTGVSGSFQFYNLFSSDRSVSGRGGVSGRLRSSFLLDVPALSLHTSGLADASATAALDTSLGSARATFSGGLVVGDVSGLNVGLTGEGELQMPVPERIGISELPQSLLPGLPDATGSLRLSGSFNAGSFSLLNFSGRATLDHGRLEGSLGASTFGNFGRLRLDAAGRISPEGEVSLDSARLRASVSVPGLSLEASGSGMTNPDGSFALNARADSRLLGLPFLSAQGSGTASGSGVSFTGTFSGPGPLYSSYITGNFDLNSRGGSTATAGVFGLTYSPSVTVSDPVPTSPGLSVIGGDPITPWVPGGLTLGASLFQYSQGNFNYISGGFMPDMSGRVLTNPRFGVSAQWHF